MTVTETMSLEERLAARAKPKAPAGRSKSPVLTRTEIKPQTAALCKVLQDFKDLEARKAQLTAELIAIVEADRLQLCKSNGAVVNSVQINELKYCTQRAFLPVFNTEDNPRLIADIVEAFGDMAPLYFTKNFQIEVDAMKLPAEILDEIDARGGATKHFLKPTELFHQDRCLKDSVRDTAARFDLRFKQYFQRA